MVIKQGHKEGQEELSRQFFKAWKSLEKLGRQNTFEKLEVKRGGHFIPNPKAYKMMVPLATHSVIITHSIF
jgi:hypothetical protein